MLKVLSILLCLALAANTIQSYEVEEENGENKDVLKVINDRGEVIEVIEVYPEEDLQVIKPVHEQICLLSHVKTNEEDKECAKRVLFTSESEGERHAAQEKCDDRTVYILQKADCGDNNNGHNVAKRACTTQVVPKSVCVRTETYCKRYGWWFGKNKCKEYGSRCVYEIRNELVVICD